MAHSPTHPAAPRPLQESPVSTVAVGEGHVCVDYDLTNTARAAADGSAAAVDASSSDGSSSDGSSSDDSCSDSSDEDGDDDKCCMCRQDVSPPTFNPIASPIDVNPPFFPRPSPGRRRSALVPRTLRIDTAQWKYRCPGCGRLTCSLGCCKAHKAWYSIDFGLIFLLTWA